jgi:hypothetical protein
MSPWQFAAERYAIMPRTATKYTDGPSRFGRKGLRSYIRARCRRIRRSRFDLLIRPAARLDRCTGRTHRTERQRRPSTGSRHRSHDHSGERRDAGRHRFYDPALSADRVQVTTGSGVEFAPRVELQRLTVLGQERYGLQVLGHTLPPSSGVDGLLGLDFFRGLRLTVDFRAGQLRLD